MRAGNQFKKYLTNDIRNLYHAPSPDGRGYTMIGSIRTKELCPICNKSYKDNGKELICKEHQTRPRLYYAYFYHEGHHRVYGFRKYSEVVDYLIDVQREVKKGKFDVRNHQAQSLKQFRFTNFLTKWIKERKADCDCGTIAPSYYRKLNEYGAKFTEFFIYDDIRNIKKRSIVEFLSHIQKEGLGRKSQKNVISVLHKMFRDAYDEYDLIDEIPKFPKISYELPEITVIDEATQSAILEKIPEHHHNILNFMFLYGVRTGEARALHHDDIDYKNMRIIIRRTFSENVLRDVTKTSRKRYLPLFDDVADMIRTMPRRLGCNFVFNIDGKPYGESALDKVWRKATKELGMHVTIHEGTRHSAASRLINRGVDIRIVQEILGHSTLQMTLRYTHVLLDTMRKALRGSNGVVNLKQKDKENQIKTGREGGI